MKFSEIFKEIISITHQDYAGWDEKKGWNFPERYLNEIIDLENKELIGAQKFKEIVDQYLVAFQDRHMYFVHTESQEAKSKTCGFRVRRFENILYVIQTGGETRFPIGTKIISIDGKTIDSISDLERNVLRESYPERESWESILNRASTIEIVNESDESTSLLVNKYDSIPLDSIHTFENIEEDTLLLTLSNFENTDEVVRVIDELTVKLKECRNLIIDIRQNYGGNANSISSLFPFIFPVGEEPNAKPKPREFNCTARNSDLFIKLCEDTRKIKITNDKATLSMLEFAEKQFRTFRGQGFVRFDFSNYLEEVKKEFVGNAHPNNVIILTDCYTASAAEEFVAACKQSSKVTVIGRATRGVNDYSDLLAVTWNNEYTFYYPISRLETKTEFHEIHGKGIQPDIYIPWTPEHLQKDIELETALELMVVQNR